MQMEALRGIRRAVQRDVEIIVHRSAGASRLNRTPSELIDGTIEPFTAGISVISATPTWQVVE